MLINPCECFGHQVAVHGMFGDAVKRATQIIRRSREPHWDKEFKFQIRGEPQILAS